MSDVDSESRREAREHWRRNAEAHFRAHGGVMKVDLSDREVDALIAPWWRKVVWTQADWRALDRARSKLRSASSGHVARSIIAELKAVR